MGLLDSDAGKRRLLSVEIPVIERYNQDRDGDFKIQFVKLGSTLVLRYRLKPMHNVYQLETRLVASYPTVRRKRAWSRPLVVCPHLLEGQTLCMWRQGSTRHDEPLGPCQVHLHFRGAGGVALAGVLRGVARDRRMAVAGREVGRSHGSSHSGWCGQRRHAGVGHALPR